MPPGPDFNSFKALYQQHDQTIAPNPTPHNLAACATWLLTPDTGLDAYKRAFTHETQLPFPNISADMLVDQAFFKSDGDRDRKYRSRAYYSANATLFLKEANNLAQDIVNTAGAMNSTEARRSFLLLQKMVFDGMYLIQHCSAYLHGNKTGYGMGRAFFSHVVSTSHAARQLMVGGNPHFAFIDNATEAGAAVLRVAIETRIRYAFLFIAIADTKMETLEPLNLSNAFSVLEQFESELILPIPLRNIVRIYKWCNSYTHLGTRDYTWLYFFALSYIWPILVGVPQIYNVDSGIQCKADTLERIHKKFEIDYCVYRKSKVPRFLRRYIGPPSKPRFRLYPIPPIDPKDCALVVIP